MACSFSEVTLYYRESNWRKVITFLNLFEVGDKLKSKRPYQGKCAIFSFPLNDPFNYTIG